MLTTTQVQLRLLRPYVEGCVINSARFKFRNWKWHLPASLKGRIKRGREGVWAEVRLGGLKGQFVGWSNAGFRLERVTEPPGMRMIIHARLLPNHRPSVRVRTDHETELMYLILYLRRTRLIMRQCKNLGPGRMARGIYLHAKSTFSYCVENHKARTAIRKNDRTRTRSTASEES
jgi:hypothetical protein